MVCKTAALAALWFISNVASRKTTDPKRVPNNAILPSKIAALTLRGEKLTTSRRVAPVPQLNCIGPEDVCKLYKVDVMRCTNEGSDYDAENIQWACKADLPEEFKLGSTDIGCEGYESNTDPYILKGSCACDYRLLLTDKGLKKYKISEQSWSSGRAGDNEAKSNPLIGGLFMVLFFAVLFIILRSIWRQSRGNTPRVRGPTRPNGDGYDDDPPPPYDSPPAPRTTPRRQNTSAQKTTASSSRSQAGTARANEVPQQGWRPGFWTGAAAGAAGEYARRRYAQTQTEPPRTGGWVGNTRQPPVQQPASSWWNSNPQPQTQPESTNRWFSNNRNENRSNTASSSSSPSAPSYSSERYESTGFGGTQRR